MWNHFVNKKVYIELRNGRRYQGRIKEIEKLNSDNIFIVLIDKFGKNVGFDGNDVALVQEEE